MFGGGEGGRSGADIPPVGEPAAPLVPWVLNPREFAGLFVRPEAGPIANQLQYSNYSLRRAARALQDMAHAQDALLDKARRADAQVHRGHFICQEAQAHHVDVEGC